MRWVQALAVTAAFAALGMGAYALSAIPDADGVFHGCVNRKSGALRVVGGGACRTLVKRHGKVVFAGERAISWNQRGPAGPQGVVGATGAAGATGSTGAVGPQGVPGPTFGSVRAGIGSSDPVANPDEASSTAQGAGKSFSFTLPAAGRVYLQAYFSKLLWDCSSGSAYAGFYLDGQPIPKTNQPLLITANSSNESMMMVGMASAAAGDHLAEVRSDCPEGTFSGSVTAYPQWTVLLVGS
jgi:hypothetical protein